MEYNELDKMEESEILDFIAKNGALIPYKSPFGEYLVIDSDTKVLVNLSQKSAKKLFDTLTDYIKNNKRYISKNI